MSHTKLDLDDISILLFIAFAMGFADRGVPKGSRELKDCHSILLPVLISPISDFVNQLIAR